MRYVVKIQDRPKGEWTMACRDVKSPKCWLGLHKKREYAEGCVERIRAAYPHMKFKIEETK